MRQHVSRGLAPAADSVRVARPPPVAVPASPLHAASPIGRGQDLSRVPVRNDPPIRIQAKLMVGQTDDPAEQEADRIADQVMRMPEPQAQREKRLGPSLTSATAPSLVPAKSNAATFAPIQAKSLGASENVGFEAPPIVHEALRSPGQPLDAATRAFMEPRFGRDFSSVRVHTDQAAARSAAAIDAQAYTTGGNIVFGSGWYEPGSPSGRHLLSHELAHTLQRKDATGCAASHIHRKLEFRPPGKGERSAFGRAQELVDRLNSISSAIQYTLKGRTLDYVVKQPAALSHFDSAMKAFIDQPKLIPMRLITSKGYVDGEPLFADSFELAYVDIDDLLADDLYSFQSDLLHFLTERSQVKNYAKRIGTIVPGYQPAHMAGKAAEAAQLQSLFHDPSIFFFKEISDEKKDTWINVFKSKALGYRVTQTVRHTSREVAGGIMEVQRADGTHVPIDVFIKERAADEVKNKKPIDYDKANEGSKWLPDFDFISVGPWGWPQIDPKRYGIGTVQNDTALTFFVEGSEEKESPLFLGRIGPGKWGREHPVPGQLEGKKALMHDIDFVHATKDTPINDQVMGVFKIGSHNAIISPDQEDKTKKKSKISNFERYGLTIEALK
jgi:hypothetical protein